MRVHANGLLEVILIKSSSRTESRWRIKNPPKHDKVTAGATGSGEVDEGESSEGNGVCLSSPLSLSDLICAWCAL